jgi:hypothetical protein
MTFILFIAGLDPAIHRTKAAGESPPFFFGDLKRGRGR